MQKIGDLRKSQAWSPLTHREPLGKDTSSRMVGTTSANGLLDTGLLWVWPEVLKCKDSVPCEPRF